MDPDAPTDLNPAISRDKLAVTSRKSVQCETTLDEETETTTSTIDLIAWKDGNTGVYLCNPPPFTTGPLSPRLHSHVVQIAK